MKRNWYDVRLLPFKSPRIGWDRELVAALPEVHILGADHDHGTVSCPDNLHNDLLAFFAPEYQVEKNTTGTILCDVVEID